MAAVNFNTSFGKTAAGWWRGRKKDETKK